MESSMPGWSLKCEWQEITDCNVINSMNFSATQNIWHVSSLGIAYSPFY